MSGLLQKLVHKYLYSLLHQKFQKLIYLHLFTDCFMKISPQSLEQNTVLHLYGTVFVTTIAETTSWNSL